MKKSKNEANHDRFSDGLKQRKLKTTKAKRHNVRQILHDIKSLKDVDYDVIESLQD